MDDSAVVRGALGRAIDAERDMCVVTTATNGRDALDALRQQHVDVVLLDVEMPVMDGLTALPLIVERHPEASVVIISSLTAQGTTVTSRALSLGAVDYVHKPSARGLTGVEAATAEITSKVRAAAHGNAIRSSARESSHGGSQHHAPVSSRLAQGVPVPAKYRSVSTNDFEPRILALAASTGGPNALAMVISNLPGDFPLPVVVTQHMPPIFTTMFAQRLSKLGTLPCEEASNATALLPGHVYVAPGDHHLTVVAAGAARTPVISINQDLPEHHCRPAADPMFRSVARVFGSGVLAVVLTGMGDDGRQGCSAIAEAGGRIIVQDEATSVVWGMPGSIVNSGIPCTVLPVHSIGAHVTSLCSVRP